MTRAALKRGEERLRAAVLAADAEALDALLADDVILCTPSGRVLRKGDELAALRSGAQRVTRYELSEVLIEVRDEVAVVSLRAELAGVWDARPFAGTFRHTRTWAREHGEWRVLLAHAATLADV